ncbi:MAG: leucine-rich repeat domain-containing protein, partial [Bacillota bacterium]
MTKKLLIAFIALGLIYGVTTFLFHVFDDDEIDASYFRYLTNGNDTITITDYEGGHKALNFPSEIEGDPVVEINIPSLSAEDHETEIESIKLPSTLETITDFDFFRRENLRSIEVASGNDHFASEDGILYSADKSELIAVPIKKNIPEFTVPASVREIGSFAFYRNDSLTILDFERGSKLESIEPYAFDDAENLESVTFPEGLKTISGAAFSDTRIRKVELPESLRA